MLSWSRSGTIYVPIRAVVRKVWLPLGRSKSKAACPGEEILLLILSLPVTDENVGSPVVWVSVLAAAVNETYLSRLQSRSLTPRA